MILEGGATAAAAQAGFDPRKLHVLDGMLQRLLEERRLGCVAVDVYRRGDLAYSARGSGDQPLTRGTPFRWYSMTKALTALTCLGLLEEGSVGIDTPLNSFIPELNQVQVLQPDGSTRPPVRRIILRDLFSHHAGLGYGIDPNDGHPVEQAYRRLPVLDFTRTLAAMAERAATIPLAADPGAGFRYSIATDMLALVIERMTERSFGEVLAERTLLPLGMLATGFKVEQNSLPPLYEHDESGRIGPVRDRALTWNASEVVLESGGGGLHGPIGDHARFALAILAGLRGERSIFSPRVLRLATEASFDLPGPPEWPMQGAYGSFLRYAAPQRSGSSVSRRALITGGAAATHALIDPEHDLLAIVMTQVLGWRAGDPPGYALERFLYEALHQEAPCS